MDRTLSDQIERSTPNGRQTLLRVEPWSAAWLGLVAGAVWLGLYAVVESLPAWHDLWRVRRFESPPWALLLLAAGFCALLASLYNAVAQSGCSAGLTLKREGPWRRVVRLDSADCAFAWGSVVFVGTLLFLALVAACGVFRGNPATRPEAVGLILGAAFSAGLGHGLNVLVQCWFYNWAARLTGGVRLRLAPAGARLRIAAVDVLSALKPLGLAAVAGAILMVVLGEGLARVKQPLATPDMHLQLLRAASLMVMWRVLGVLAYATATALGLGAVVTLAPTRSGNAPAWHRRALTARPKPSRSRHRRRALVSEKDVDA